MSSTSKAEHTIGARVAFAAGFGNFMEWFDFALYGFFAVTIARVFFPTQSSGHALLSTLAVFGAAFITRPFGGMLLGHVGDRIGRRSALAASVILMAVATTLVAALPTYASVGFAAPALLILVRCLQGLSTGGEWPSSSSFVVEFAPPNRRALWGSIVTSMAAAGAIAGALIAIGFSSWLTPDQLLHWGWRLPFLLAAPLGVVGLYLRLRLDDTPVYRELQRRRQVASAPLRDAIVNDREAIGLTFVCAAVGGLGYYYLSTYAINFLLSARVGMPKLHALVAVAIGLSLYGVMCPLMGIVSDRVGRRRSMLIGCGGLALAAIPAFLLMSTGSVAAVIVAIAAMGVFQALANTTHVALLIELFPSATRLSGGSLGFTLGTSIVAGPGPLIAAALASGFNVPGAAAFYLVAVTLVSVGLLARYLPETRGCALVAEVPQTADAVI
jgi:MFS transporter, MHS family, proline/betaine transporter